MGVGLTRGKWRAWCFAQLEVVALAFLMGVLKPGVGVLTANLGNLLVAEEYKRLAVCEHYPCVALVVGALGPGLRVLPCIMYIHVSDAALAP